MLSVVGWLPRSEVSNVNAAVFCALLLRPRGDLHRPAVAISPSEQFSSWCIRLAPLLANGPARFFNRFYPPRVVHHKGASDEFRFLAVGCLNDHRDIRPSDIRRLRGRARRFGIENEEEYRHGLF
jgi:hypothetical protein